MTTRPGARSIAVITGGAQGIGKAISRELLGSGFSVVIADSDREAGRETEREYARLGELRFLRTDVSSEADVRALVRFTAKTFGRITALVNNAAISDNRPLGRLPLAAWNRVLRVNVTGPFLCAKHTAPHLRSQRGAIVNIASTRAFMSEPHTEAYSASKGGIVALTHALAASLAPHVRVNCISPGWVDVSGWKKKRVRAPAKLSELDHSQHLAGRVGKPEDIASLVGYLLSPETTFITGANFIVDGGMTKKMIYR